MAYNPSIHTASNKAYGVTGKPVDARYWYYDTATFTYRPYASVAEVKAYLIAGDRKGATVQVGEVEYWWLDVNDLSDAGLVVKITSAVEITIPSGAMTYTLNAGELAAVNAIGRLPVFTIVSDTGQQWSDMYPTYTPYNGAGAYTNIVIQLNSDANDFVAQFS